jgi:hypothetical protein
MMRESFNCLRERVELLPVDADRDAESDQQDDDLDEAPTDLDALICSANGANELTVWISIAAVPEFAVLLLWSYDRTPCSGASPVNPTARRFLSTPASPNFKK